MLGFMPSSEWWARQGLNLRPHPCEGLCGVQNGGIPSTDDGTKRDSSANEARASDQNLATLPTVSEFSGFPSYRRELYRRFTPGTYPSDSELPPAPDTVARTVYFIQAADGSIKIGQARDVAKRMAALQTSHAYPLHLLATINDPFLSEAHYHARFAEHRLHGEWFRPHREVLAEVARLNRSGVCRETAGRPIPAYRREGEG